MGQINASRGRDQGQRKILFDTRRCAAFHNLHVARRSSLVNLPGLRDRRFSVLLAVLGDRERESRVALTGDHG